MNFESELKFKAKKSLSENKDFLDDIKQEKSHMVEYHNSFNKIIFNHFNEVDFNVFFAICYIMKNKRDRKIIIPFENIKKIIEPSEENFIKDKKRFFKKVVDFASKLNGLRRERLDTDVESGKSIYEAGSFFESIKAYEKEEFLELKIHRDSLQYINNVITNYTKFELKEFCAINNKYAKNLFRLLKQWENVGLFRISMKDFRELMSVPENYTQGNINQKIIEPAVSKLNEKNIRGVPHFTNLVCERIKVKGAGNRGQGGMVTELKFSFAPPPLPPKKLKPGEVEKKYGRIIRRYNPEIDGEYENINGKWIAKEEKESKNKKVHFAPPPPLIYNKLILINKQKREEIEIDINSRNLKNLFR